MRTLKKALSVALAAALAVGMLAGCKSGGRSSGKTTSGEAVTFPLKTAVTLKVWEPANSSLISKYPNMSDLPKYKEIQKRLNVTIQEINPPVGEERDQFNLMLSSGNLPDIFGVYAVQNYYTGGAQKAYDDGIIVKLNDLMKKDAPDLEKLYSNYKNVDALSKTDSGDYLGVPFVKGAASDIIVSGPIVRKDWLDKLSLSAPVTMDDWENMLTQFKTKLGATAPLMISYGTNGGYNDDGFNESFLVGTYGIALNYFVEDGKVKFGSTDPRFKDFLTEMAKWYKEGLIDPEIGSNSSKTVDAKVSNNKTGAFYGYAGGAVGKYELMMSSIDPNFKLVGIQYPVQKKGDTNLFFQTGPMAYPNWGCISSKSTHKDAAMAYLNYGYSKEGHLLYNFGTEGTTFSFDSSNYPKYTKLITNNPDGLSMQAALMAYGWASTNGAEVQDSRYQEQYLSSDDQKASLKAWAAESSKVTTSNSWYPNGRLTSEETSEVASNETQIQTYRDEQLLKFITGVTPINDSTFNAYVSQMKSMGLDQAIKVRQTAEDRFRKANPDYYKSSKSGDPVDYYKNLK